MIKQKDILSNFMKFDVLYHITELQEGTGLDYSTVSRHLNTLMNEGIVERSPIGTGNYVKHTEAGRIRAKMQYLIREIKHYDSVVQKFLDSKNAKLEELKSLQAQLNEIKQKREQ